jgi:histidinol-phosphate phosphatase family protein
MKSAAIFFDRDNTLIINDGYLGDPAGVVLVPDAAESVARARDLGYAVVTVSNQSGVAKGLFTEEAVAAVNQRMDELLRKSNPGAIIDRHEFCPFHPDAVVERYRVGSDLRKPKPGMILRAAKALDLDLKRSWLIGDADRDIQAGKAAGCRTILLRLSAAPYAVMPDATVQSLTQAMEFIARQQKAPAQGGG